MKCKVLTVCLLCFSLNLNAQSNNIFTAKDKQLHGFTGAGIGLIIFPFTEKKSDLNRVLISSGVSLGIATGWELYQHKTGTGTVESYDVIYTVAGTVLITYGLIKLNRAINKRRLKKSGPVW